MTHPKPPGPAEMVTLMTDDIIKRARKLLGEEK